MGDKPEKIYNQGARWTLLAFKDAGAWLKHPHPKCAELLSWLLFIPRDMQLPGPLCWHLDLRLLNLCLL